MNAAKRADWRRRLRGAQAAMIRKLRRAMLAELELCADDFARGFFDATAHAQRTEKIIVDHYRATAIRFGVFAIEMLVAEPLELGRQYGPRLYEQRQAARAKLQTREGVETVLFSSRVSTLVTQYAPLRARRIAARTNQIVTAAVAEAAEAGLGEAAAARLIRQRVARDRLSVARARTIARTEINAAQNASLLGSADELGVSYVRIWSTVSDGRERLSHAQADEQTIGPGQKFKVGDAELDHPGDPTGPAEEIINCRCTMLLEPT